MIFLRENETKNNPNPYLLSVIGIL